MNKVFLSHSSNDKKYVQYGLLSFMSAYGIVPTELLLSVLELSKGYQNAFTYLKNATICRYLGVSNEYIEVNPVISDLKLEQHFFMPIKESPKILLATISMVLMHLILWLRKGFRKK